MKPGHPAHSAERSEHHPGFFSFARQRVQEKKIMLRSKSEIRVVALKEIICLQVGDHLAIVYINSKPDFSCCRTLDAFEAELHEFDFCRVHDNCIVNLHHVERFDIGCNLITMNDGRTLNVSRRRIEAFIERLERSL